MSPTEHVRSTVDADAVRAVAFDYIEGWYLGDAGLRSVSKQRMVELTAGGGGRDVTDPAIEVFVDDVSGGLATARTVCADFVDYLHVIDTPAGWKIAHILFRNVE